MNNSIKELDRAVEATIHNLRGCLQTTLGVQRKTAEVLMAGGLFGLETFRHGDLTLGLINSSIGLVFLKLALSTWPKGKKSISSAEKLIDPEIEYYKYLRLLGGVLFTGSNFMMSYRLELDWLYFYIFLKYHDDDDQGIINWAKGKLQELKESIKIPGVQPSPA